MKSTKVSLIRVVADFYPQKGGSITHIIELSKSINKYLNRQLILAPNYLGENTRPFDSSLSIPVRRINFSKSRNPQLNLLHYAIATTREIKSLLKQGYPIDVVQVHFNFLGQLLLICFWIYRIPIPIVIMHHGSSIQVETKRLRSKTADLIALNMYRFFRPSYYFQLDDGTINQFFLNKLKSMNIKYAILFHAVDTEMYDLREDKGSNSEFIILSNHRLVEFKRIDLSILAFKKFLQDTGYPKEVRLKIVGSGNLLNELKDLVDISGLSPYVDFLGEMTIEATREEIKSADTVLGTSIISNVNRSIQEAMACGKPVIVFDSIGNNSLFVNMCNAVVEPVGDVDAIARDIKLLYNNPELRASIGKNARNTIVESRNWDARVRQELSLYEEIISQK